MVNLIYKILVFQNIENILDSQRGHWEEFRGPEFSESRFFIMA